MGQLLKGEEIRRNELGELKAAMKRKESEIAELQLALASAKQTSESEKEKISAEILSKSEEIASQLRAVSEELKLSKIKGDDLQNELSKKTDENAVLQTNLA